MKKEFYSIFSIFTSALLFASCISNEPHNPDISEDADVMFGLNINDMLSRVEVEWPEECLSIQELQLLAEDNNLQARFSIVKNRIITDEDYIKGILNKNIKKTFYKEDINAVNGMLIANPIPLPLAKSSLIRFAVWRKETKTEKAKIIFSSVSKFAKDESLISSVDEHFLLPMIIEVKTDDIVTKKSVDISVVCTEKRTPHDFGFDMWDIESLDFKSLPFVVYGYNDELGSIAEEGDLSIYKADAAADGTTAFGDILVENIHFDGSFENINQLSKLWFADNITIPNENEFFGYKIVTLSGKTYAGSTSVAELLKYNESNAWSHTNK